MQLLHCTSILQFVCIPRRLKTLHFFSLTKDRLCGFFLTVGLFMLEEHAHAFSELGVFGKGVFFFKSLTHKFSVYLLFDFNKSNKISL